MGRATAILSARSAFRPLVEALPAEVDLPRALSRLRGRRGLVALDSAAGEPRRYSIAGFDPLETLRPPRGPDEGIPRVRELLGSLGPPEREVPGPFQGGFLGALAYDLGVLGERPLDVAPEPWGFPLAIGGLYADFLVRDERRGESWLVLGEGLDDREPPQRRREELFELLLGEPAPPEPVSAGPARRCTPPEEHRRRIERCRELIAQGEIYQANLAHRFTAPLEGDPVDLYLRLRAVNPAPYMGLVAWDEGTDRSEGSERRGAVLSASPELLLEHDGRTARTRPIKGTAPRGATPAEDRALVAALLASEKDRAELAMIVDLERNDLGRTAALGSVRVESMARLESYARVHHLVADVAATPRPGADALAVLAALFPGGSVTGAPKLRAMQAIADLEGEGRGFFCGTLGFADTAGRCAFNVLIRTMLWRPGEVSFRVGGGITWGSDPEEEDQETLAKARGMLDALID